jgi:hypothetical protein
MTNSSSEASRLVDKLRKALPFRASVRMERVDFLAREPGANGRSLRGTVTGVYDAGESIGPMCQIALDDEPLRSTPLVLPIAHLAVERSRAVSRDVAAFRRRRTERADGARRR